MSVFGAGTLSGDGFEGHPKGSHRILRGFALRSPPPPSCGWMKGLEVLPLAVGPGIKISLAQTTLRHLASG